MTEHLLAGSIMEDAREFEGKDLAEALDAATRSLGIPAERFRYRITEEGRRGLFGLGARLVRIRVEPVAESETPPLDARPLDAPADPAPLETFDLSELEDSVREMIRMMGLDLTLRAEAAPGSARLVLDGPDRRFLVQKDAEVLSALQFLLNRMARRAWPEVGHVVVECEGYRDRREDDLVELAREVARQVSRTGRPKTLESMNPYERRVVHLTVREFPELTSHSVGDGFMKQVTVAPVGHDGRI